MYGKSRQSWILDSMDSMQVLDFGFFVCGTRIPYSNLKLDFGFLELYYDSIAKDFEIREFEFLYMGL